MKKRMEEWPEGRGEGRFIYPRVVKKGLRVTKILRREKSGGHHPTEWKSGIEKKRRRVRRLGGKRKTDGMGMHLPEHTEIEKKESKRWEGGALFCKRATGDSNYYANNRVS